MIRLEVARPIPLMELSLIVERQGINIVSFGVDPVPGQLRNVGRRAFFRGHFVVSKHGSQWVLVMESLAERAKTGSGAK